MSSNFSWKKKPNQTTNKQTNTQTKPCENLPVKIGLGNLSYDLPLPRGQGDTSLQGREQSMLQCFYRIFTIRFNIQITEQIQITHVHG